MKLLLYYVRSLVSSLVGRLEREQEGKSDEIYMVRGRHRWPRPHYFLLKPWPAKLNETEYRKLIHLADTLVLILR
jgi:hypothetical protein